MLSIENCVESNLCRPRDHVVDFGRRYPKVWKQSEKMREINQYVKCWPNWCYLPIVGYLEMLTHSGSKSIPAICLKDALPLSAVGTWRATQGIYRFDPTLFESIVSTHVEGDLPCDLLHCLPEWCVYIETQGMQYQDDCIRGFFAYLDWNVQTKKSNFIFLLDADKGFIPIIVELGPWPLKTALLRVFQELYKKEIGEMAVKYQKMDAGEVLGGSAMAPILPTIESMLSLVLYLCAQNAEIGDGSCRPQNPSPKNGFQLLTPDRPTTWNVGVRMGAAIRHARSTESVTKEGAKVEPRPHIRRAHWHSFRSGPSKGGDGISIPNESRKLILHWLPPIMVNTNSIDELPATIRPVEVTS